MDYAGKPKKPSQESEYTMLDHGSPNTEGYSGDDGMAEARQDLIESQNDQEVIKGFTSSLAQVRAFEFDQNNMTMWQLLDEHALDRTTSSN